MITKEELVKILKNRYYQNLEEVADEILALDKKEEFPKYGLLDTYDRIEMKGYKLGKIYKLLNFNSKDQWTVINDFNIEELVHNTHFQIVSKEEFDKQELQEQISKLEHGKWYNLTLTCFKELQHWLIKFDNVEGKNYFGLKGKCLNGISEFTSRGNMGNVNTITSITPSTNEEVEKYFPDEFKVKLDYEILSFIRSEDSKYKGTTFNLSSNGLYNPSFKTSDLTLEHCLKGGFNIKSVKRLSDGEVFTVGDYFTYVPNGTKHKIISITNGSNVGLIIHGENNCSAIEKYGFTKIIKAEQPILVTEDGVDVSVGDSIFYVFNDETPIGNGGFNQKWKPIQIKASFNNTGNNYYKLFSTLAAAEEYIIENKPCLSIKEFNSILNEYDGSTCFMQGNGNIIEKLKQLVKSK